MNKDKFPLLAVLLGLPLLIALISLDDTVLPLMTRLFMSEFGAIVSGFGVFFGVRSLRENGFNIFIGLAVLICSLMAIKFAVTGFLLWPQG